MPEPAAARLQQMNFNHRRNNRMDLDFSGAMTYRSVPGVIRLGGLAKRRSSDDAPAGKACTIQNKALEKREGFVVSDV